MRKIKFRAKTWSGHTVYGSYYHESADGIEIHSIIDKHGKESTVEPESVRQLVGFDVNGCEVYEGDTVVIESKYGELAYRAHLRGFATNAGGVSLTKNQMKMARRVDERDS